VFKTPGKKMPLHQNPSPNNNQYLYNGFKFQVNLDLGVPIITTYTITIGGVHNSTKREIITEKQQSRKIFTRNILIIGKKILGIYYTDIVLSEEFKTGKIKLGKYYTGKLYL